MPRDTAKLVLKGSARRGKCKFCRQRIVWATTAPHGKTLPFDREPVYAPELRTENGLVFERWPVDTLHIVTCKSRPPATSRKHRSTTPTLEAR